MMSNELDTVLKDAPKTSDNKVSTQFVHDVMDLYRSEKGSTPEEKQRNFQADLNKVNDELKKNGFPDLQIVGVIADGDKQFLMTSNQIDHTVTEFFGDGSTKTLSSKSNRPEDRIVGDGARAARELPPEPHEEIPPPSPQRPGPRDPKPVAY